MVYKTIALPIELRRRQSQSVLYARLNKCQSELHLPVHLATQSLKKIVHIPMPFLCDSFCR